MLVSLWYISVYQYILRLKEMSINLTENVLVILCQEKELFITVLS